MRLQFAYAFVRMPSHVSMLQPSSSGVMHAKPRGVHGTGQARQWRHEHASTQEMRARKCTVRAVRAGASSGWSHFDALQRRHVRRSWSTAAYFESSRVCRPVILPKVLQTLPWGLKSTPRSRWHPLGRRAESRTSNPRFSICKPFIEGRNLGFYPRNGSRQKAGST